MTSQSNSDMWMGAASSDISMRTIPVPDREQESSWKTLASSQDTPTMDAKSQEGLQDNVGAPCFGKEVLEEEWYTPETSLMELSCSSPYGISAALLESSLSFDGTNTLVASFRSAPPTLGMDLESTRSRDDLACTSQGSSAELLSSISPGGEFSQNAPMDSFSSALPTNRGVINLSGTLSNRSSVHRTFPTTASEADPTPALLQDKTGKDGSDGPRNKRTDASYLQGQQTWFPKRASPPTSASNDSSVDTPEKASPQVRNQSARVILQSGSDDPNDVGFDADDYDVKDDDDLDESGDGSGGNYEVDEGAGHGAERNGKGKGKRGLPAKNLMAERRRRKKLNDRLYMLRSVVPKITKMDRASILGDAIEYLKELLQRISDIHNELEEVKLEQSRSMPSSPNPRPTPGYPAAVKEECPVLPNPESQPPRVEVRKREGQALNIHMFCARRPGLLLSTVRALDALGLDVQQAVISCFNGFALDLFRAEAKDVDVGPDEIKAVLLLTAGCGMHSLQ